MIREYNGTHTVQMYDRDALSMSIEGIYEGSIYYHKKMRAFAQLREQQSTNNDNPPVQSMPGRTTTIHKGIWYANSTAPRVIADVLRDCANCILWMQAGALAPLPMHDPTALYAALQRVATSVIACSKRIKDVCCRKRAHELGIQELWEFSSAQCYNDYAQAYPKQQQQQQQ